MEMDSGMIWDAILSVFVPVAIIVVRSLSSRLEKMEDLLARTREEYATKYEMTNNTANMMAAMRRLEDKIDELIKKG
jgi:uncharacterized membrane protein YhiD involved in acid resistance